MQDTNDLYAELQVHPSAAPKVIQAAYKGLVRIYHPDVNKSPDANERMKRINLAYAVLRNPDKRAQYDRQREYRQNAPQPQPETTPAKRSASTDVARANVPGVKAPIHWAAEAGRADTVRDLIAAGADVHVADDCGKTPLDLATQKGHAAVVQTLTAAGANAARQPAAQRNARQPQAGKI